MIALMMMDACRLITCSSLIERWNHLVTMSWMSASAALNARTGWYDCTVAD